MSAKDIGPFTIPSRSERVALPAGYGATPYGRTAYGTLIQQRPSPTGDPGSGFPLAARVPLAGFAIPNPED